MSLRDFLSKQFIDVIDWTEPEDGILAYRYPMQDREIQNGGKLTVRESQYAVFVNEGKVADAFGPGLYTLNTQTLPILTYLKNWDKAFQSPFKSDVYFFSARTQTDQHWGTPNPVTIRDKEFGAIRLRGFGIYSYHLADAKSFYTKISGTRDIYHVTDLEGQLRQPGRREHAHFDVRGRGPRDRMRALDAVPGLLRDEAVVVAHQAFGHVQPRADLRMRVLEGELMQRGQRLARLAHRAVTRQQHRALGPRRGRGHRRGRGGDVLVQLLQQPRLDDQGGRGGRGGGRRG